MERRDTHASELTVRIRTGALLTLILVGAFQARQVPGILEGLSTLLGLLGCFELLRAMGLLQGRWAGWYMPARPCAACFSHCIFPGSPSRCWPLQRVLPQLRGSSPCC